jgi:acyl-CoA reductase-like NAD-dependent aldehyde dehydrogenase
MMNSGQQCIAPDYVLCHKDVVDKFCTSAAQWAQDLYLKDCKTNGNFGRIVGRSGAIVR